MSLILLCVPAFADRLYWTAPPDAEDEAAAAALLPGAVAAPLEQLGGAGVAGDPAREIAALEAELGAVRPLLAEFDGELQVMSRLATATAKVLALRNDADAALLWRALVLEGYAVHRYFQAGLATEPGAAAYRAGVGADVYPTAWIEAVALGGLRDPLPEDIPEPAERIAYDAVRAALLAQPTGRVELGRIPVGAEAWLDGSRLDGVRLVPPGRHYLHVAQGGLLLSAEIPTVAPGDSRVLALPIGPKERAEIVALTQVAKAGTPAPEPLLAAIGAGEPVYLGVPGRPSLWRVDQGRYTAVAAPKDEVEGRVAVHARLGGGWVSTGDFFLQNVEAGAPYEAGTVNAGGVAAGLGVSGSFSLLTLGGGVDGIYTLGDWHSLPTGDSETRLFGWIHANAGLPWVQVAAGPLLPWYFGLGGQARVPLFSRVELAASGVYGFPLTLERDEGQPAFQPTAAWAAWGGLGMKLN